MSSDLSAPEVAPVAVAIVVPVRNEQGNLAPLIGELTASPDGRSPYEIIKLKDGTRDTGCGLKAFRRDVFLSMPYFDGLHRFLPALVRREGFDIAYVDVTDRPRHSGVSNYGFFDRLWIGIMDLAGVWWLIRRKKSTPAVTEVF